MGWVKTVVLLYALLNVGGGIDGYVAKHSVPSIISGIAAGIILIAGMAASMTWPRAGYVICAVVVVGDLGFFGPHLVKTHAVWPDAIMVGASVITLICILIAIFGVKSAA